MRGFVGRSLELTRAQLAIDRAFAGEGSLVCFCGEAGIGKTRLVERAAVWAEERGARVAWGRVWESGGAPAYWPFIEVFRALGLDAPFADAERAVGPGAAEARFDAFDGAARRLKAAAMAVPVILVLDDLHAADVPSLLFLQFLARAIKRSKLCVLSTHRESDAWSDAGVRAALSKVTREAEVVGVPRLSRDDVAAWLTEVGRPRSAADADELHRLSEGNPLFVEELLRVGGELDARHLTLGLADVLDEHLARAPVETRPLLDAASVLGREFDPKLLRTLSGQPIDTLEVQLAQAIEVGLMRPVAGGQARFAHVLLRDRLYLHLSPSQRAALHWRAGQIFLEEQPDLAAAAHHLLEGHTAGCIETALEVSRDAAREALGRFAFEDATRIAARALQLVISGAPSRVKLELELAAAEGRLRSGEANLALTSCTRIASEAEQLGAPDLVAQAALTYSAELVSATVDPIMVGLLRRALSLTSEGDSCLRARLLARLASALMPPATREIIAEILHLAELARAMASRLGDPETSLYVLTFAAAASGYLQPREERTALVTEVITLATALNHRPTLLNVGGFYAATLLERGLRAEAEVMRKSLEGWAAELRQSHYQWRIIGLDALFHAFDGDLEQANRLGRELRAAGRAAGSRAAELAWAIQRIGIAQASGEPSSITPDADDVLAIIGRVPMLTPHKAWVLAALGRGDDARVALAPVVGNPFSFPWLLIAADACAILESAQLGAGLYKELEQECFRNRMFWGPAGLSLIGPTSLVLADLAIVLGQRDEAARHYADAIELTERIGAHGLLRLSRARRERAFGAARTRAPTPRSWSGVCVELCAEGEVWAVRSLNGTLRVKDGKGMRYLAELVQSPGRERFVLELIGAEEASESAGAVFDARAKAELRQRVEDLRERAEEAERMGDTGRSERARAELNALADALSGAVGLGGRDRKQASNVERARINVQRRIKDAISRIAELDPDLGRYLSSTVKTGTYCSFTPL